MLATMFTLKSSVCLVEFDPGRAARAAGAIGMVSTTFLSFPNYGESKVLRGSEVAIRVDDCHDLAKTVKGKYHRTDILLCVAKGGKKLELRIYHFQSPGGGISYLSTDQTGREMNPASIFGEFFKSLPVSLAA